MRGSPRKSDGSHEDDDLPLKYIAGVPSSLKKNLSIRELRRESMQDCEFCERKCKNRYDMLIHNSKHIIIPLMKLLPCTCIECGWYCISEEHLQNHISVRHKELIRKYSDNSDHDENEESQVVTVEITRTNHDSLDSDELFIDDNQTLADLIKKKRSVSQPESILQNFVINCKVDVEKFQTPWLKHTPDISIDRSNSTIGNTDDITGDSAIQNGGSASQGISEADELYGVSAPETEENMNGCDYFPSVHFEDLKRPGIFHCRLCFRRFPNRYDVITHEVDHMDLSRVVNRKRKKKKHIAQVATETKEAVEITKPCQRGGLQPSIRVAQTVSYYKNHCSKCSKGFKSIKGMTSHEEKCPSEVDQTIDMCDACYLHVRTKKTVEYTRMGGFQNLLETHKCERCGRRYHELVTLKVTHRRSRVADRIQFEDDKGEVVRKSRTGKPPPLSNSTRLKLIQNRIKFINKYNAR